jgi:hypothetical protein
VTRVEQEFAKLAVSFPRAILCPSRNWVEVPDYLLPELFNHTTTRVRMPLTPAYPDVPPDNFYVSSGLRLRDGQGLANYSEVGQFGEVWGQFSWHPKKWRAASDIDRGDNMMTFFNSVRKRLEEGR